MIFVWAGEPRRVERTSSGGRPRCRLDLRGRRQEHMALRHVLRVAWPIRQWTNSGAIDSNATATVTVAVGLIYIVDAVIVSVVVTNIIISVVVAVVIAGI